MKLIEFDIKGIKCDNPACNFRDMTIAFDPDKFLNAPCPKCGASLFTQKDYDSMMRMFKFASFVNMLFKPVSFLFRKSQRTRSEVKMNGTGKVTVEQLPDV